MVEGSDPHAVSTRRRAIPTLIELQRFIRLLLKNIDQIVEVNFN